MSNAAVNPVAAEKTFRSFSNTQGANYANYRPNYHQSLYQTIIDYHTSTGGELKTILDVGCGPGTAIRTLSPQFSHAIGLDPSQGMVDTARSLGGTTSTSQPIRFEVSAAEELGSQLEPPIPNGSVDIITAATAAHWFDMAAFWSRAAQVLKPGGSVALWTSSSIRVHPSLPNADAIQAVIDKLVNETLSDYMTPGNLLTHDLYRDLPLPWTLPTPVSDFDKTLFLRKEWNTGATFDANDHFFDVQAPVTLEMWEKVMSTASPVVRWREAHPDAVGTESDVIRATRRELENLLHQAGVEKGKELVEGNIKGVLMIIKKRA